VRVDGVGVGRGLWAVLRAAAVAVAFAACGSVAGGVRVAAPPVPDPDAIAEAVVLAREATAAQAPAEEPLDEEEEAYDPWERFNERMFAFNYNVDRYVLKPVARGYRAVVPERVQIMIANGFDNIAFVPRVVNSLLQGKVEGALREVSRFLVNSTLGFGGLFDAGKAAGLEPSKEDFGQTLGVWGVGPGPYLVLPLMPPMTVRDGIGRGVDGAMDPLSYVLPFIWERLVMKVGETVNDRALNYELFQGVEETTLDLYSSVRHFYLKRREQQIKE
jgi:phospholipid-binding lipoprotein MlaA